MKAAEGTPPSAGRVRLPGSTPPDSMATDDQCRHRRINYRLHSPGSFRECARTYEERVERAVTKILNSNSWTQPQRRWLERIGKQLLAETVVDREALDRGEFKAKGGFNRINKVFDGKLEHVLGEINEGLWEEAG